MSRAPRLRKSTHLERKWKDILYPTIMRHIYGASDQDKNMSNSLLLRNLTPLKIDHQIDTECIVDPGSQIIAMSEAMCHDLVLIYDPTIQLNMQLVNGEID